MKKQASKEQKIGLSILLSNSDAERLSEICRSRKQSKADFLRSALDVYELVPVLKTKPLTGACLARHLARVKREKREEKQSRKKK